MCLAGSAENANQGCHLRIRVSISGCYCIRTRRRSPRRHPHLSQASRSRAGGSDVHKDPVSVLRRVHSRSYIHSPFQSLWQDFTLEMPSFDLSSPTRQSARDAAKKVTQGEVRTSSTFFVLGRDNDVDFPYPPTDSSRFTGDE